MQHDEADAFFISMMAPIIEPIMTGFQQREANADHRTDQHEITWQEF